MLARVGAIVGLLVLVGCGGSGAAPGMKQVTLAELEEETAALAFFSYTGNDEQFHYFKTPTRLYKVKRDEWAQPNMPKVSPELGIEVFVRVKDGKVTVPDPKDVAKHFPQQ
jgi:hypothetical protein